MIELLTNLLTCILSCVESVSMGFSLGLGTTAPISYGRTRMLLSETNTRADLSVRPPVRLKFHFSSSPLPPSLSRTPKVRSRSTPHQFRRQEKEGRRLNGFLGLSLNDKTVLFRVILLDKKASGG